MKAKHSITPISKPGILILRYYLLPLSRSYYHRSHPLPLRLPSNPGNRYSKQNLYLRLLYIEIRLKGETFGTKPRRTTRGFTLCSSAY